MPSFYKTKIAPFSGARWAEVSKKAFRFFNAIKSRTKRRPYVRSEYFGGQKVFLDLFVRHLFEKIDIRDKTRRIKYLACAIDLIEHNRLAPETKPHSDDSSCVVHRFTGITQKGEIFRVQIKERRRTGEKWFMSVFPFET